MKKRFLFISAAVFFILGSVVSVCASNGVDTESDFISICSFNIQFLGSSPVRNDEALASAVKDYDIVVVQELVAPPYEMKFPDGTEVKTDQESAEFFDAMAQFGFIYWLSEEDTGTGDKNHVNSNSTEWWVVFYKPGEVEQAKDLPHGFLADDRKNHPCYERVPYAFAFRSPNKALDFVLISVHLKPNPGPKNRNRRKHELSAIAGWIYESESPEKDYIILGDMNIYNFKELVSLTPEDFISLNDECRATNTNLNSPKPYDHVMYRPKFTKEIDVGFDMAVVNLIEAMATYWNDDNTYPGKPYVHDEFRKYFSDHHPVVFRIKIPSSDDD